MATNYVSPGHAVTVPAPSGGVSSGDGVLIGMMFGVAEHDAAATGMVTLVRSGIFALPKPETQVWAIGAAIYWDADAVGGAVATTATTAGNVLIGFAAANAANPSTSGHVCLTGATPAAAAS